jgi:hypothetical protein
MKPGKNDRKYQVLITGAELRELKSLALPESFGLERRVQRYEGKRPIGLYRWDLECLLDTLSLELEDRFLHPRLRRKDLPALRSLHDQLRRDMTPLMAKRSPKREALADRGKPQRDCLASRTSGYT